MITPQRVGNRWIFMDIADGGSWRQTSKGVGDGFSGVMMMSLPWDMGVRAPGRGCNMGPRVFWSLDESLTPGSGVLGERSDGTLGLETEKLSEMGDRLPGEWVADPVGEGDRPWLMGLPGVDNIFLR